MNSSTFHLKCFFLISFLMAILLQRNVLQPGITGVCYNRLELPEINLDLTADMKVVFLGIPPEYVDETDFSSNVSRSASQFVYPNNITWNLNVSVFFHQFPENVTDSLRDNAFHSENITYYNITLLDIMLSQFEDLAIPKHGYLITFMWIPDDAIDHSWFYVQERPDLFLGRTDYLNGASFKYWAFPPNFGGLRRALYFDVSNLMEETPTKLLVTNTVVRLFNDGLADVFPDLLGTEDSRMIAADVQRYENYKVKILWFNGTCEQFYPERIKESFQNFVPWINWSISIGTKIMDSALNDLIQSRTEELSQPLTYRFVLNNGTSLTVKAWRNVKCDFFADSGEYDPLIRYFFDHVADYFNLTDLEDKSVIPVVFLQLGNDTAFGGAPQAGVSWFPHNVVVVGFQGDMVTATGESGPLFLTHILRHEIGHWLSISHHSSAYECGDAKIVCSMRSLTNHFCAFCKDATARMSFLSYYNATVEALSHDQTKSEALSDDLDNALQLFYDWHYVEAMDAIMSVYHKARTSVYEFEVNVDDAAFNISVKTDSTISNFTFDKSNKTITFEVEGDPGTTGFFNLTLPIVLLGGPYTVRIDDTTVLEDYDAPTTGTNAFIYCAYNHSSYTIEIEGTTVIPEFATLTVLLLFSIAASLATIVYKKKHATWLHPVARDSFTDHYLRSTWCAFSLGIGVWLLRPFFLLP